MDMLSLFALSFPWSLVVAIGSMIFLDIVRVVRARGLKKLDSLDKTESALDKLAKVDEPLSMKLRDLVHEIYVGHGFVPELDFVRKDEQTVIRVRGCGKLKGRQIRLLSDRLFPVVKRFNRKDDSIVL